MNSQQLGQQVSCTYELAAIGTARTGPAQAQDGQTKSHCGVGGEHRIPLGSGEVNTEHESASDTSHKKTTKNLGVRTKIKK